MRLRGRFTLWFTLAALVPIAAATLTTCEVVSESYRQQFERVKQSAEDVAIREWEARRAQVERASAALADRDHEIAGALLIEMEKAEGEVSAPALRGVRDRARAVGRGMGLDILLVLDEGGRVLVAPHNQAALDGADPGGSDRMTTGEAYAAEEAVWTGDRLTEELTVQAARTVREGQHAVTVVAGTLVGDEILAAADKLDQVKARLVRAEPGDEAPGEGGATIRIPLEGPGGTARAWINARVSQDELRGVLADVTRNAALLGLAALAGTTALGVWVSRRMTRDLDALVRGAEAASRGDLEHRVPVRSHDEVGEVGAAFNVMMGELAESKARLAGAERMAAWRDIARRLAHEIKNPLTPIQMAMETLRRAKEKRHPSFDEVFDESTKTVLEEAARLKRTVGQLSELAQLPRAELSLCDVSEVAGRALSLYRGDDAVAGDIEEGVPEVLADRDQLAQVLVNLIENAREAAGEGGRVRLFAGATADGGAVLGVDDDGPGIDPGVRERLFEPYITTKKESGGTGLGLAIAHRVVAEHGGTIAVEDAPLGGARFRVILPAARGPS